MAEVLALLSILYSDVIDPIFCLLYAYILVRIIMAKSSKFRSEFYVFSVATGIAAISNVLILWVNRMVDVRFQYFPNRGYFLNVLSLLSHLFSLSLSIGKSLSVTARFTAICFMHKKDIWTIRVIFVCILLMFGLPTVAYCYFLFLPPLFAPTANGYGVYLGITNPGYIIAKAIATCGYLVFFVTTVPMCILSVLRLRTERKEERLDSDRHEKMLTFYSIVLTSSHMIKSIMQMIWFVALVLDMKELQTAIISNLLFPNSLSAFAEPVLLLITSPKLRNEIIPFKRRKDTVVKTTTLSNNVRKRTSDLTHRGSRAALTLSE